MPLPLPLNQLNTNSINFPNPSALSQAAATSGINAGGGGSPQKPALYYSSIIKNKDLPQDYLRIINEIEEKRSRSKANRFQPSQAPQSSNSQPHNSLPPQQRSISHVAQPPAYSPGAAGVFSTFEGLEQQYPQIVRGGSTGSSTVPGGLGSVVSQEQNVNYLDQLYHNQALQSRTAAHSITQTPLGYNHHSQTTIELQDLVAPANFNGTSLLHYYQQKFNLLQQAQQEIQTQYKNLYTELQQITSAPSSQAAPPGKAHQAHTQQLRVPTPTNFAEVISGSATLGLPQTQTLASHRAPTPRLIGLQSTSSHQQIQPYMATDYSNPHLQQTPQGSLQNFSVTIPITPPPREKPLTLNNRQVISPRPLMHNIDDLYQVINKKVLHDFERKPYSLISSQYKNLSDLQSQEFQQQQQQYELDLYQSQPPSSSRQGLNKFSASHHGLNLYAVMNLASQHVQKHLRGYIIRKRFKQFTKVYYFFKRVEQRFVVNDLVASMKDAFLSLKNIKTQLLKNYINHCAIKIQKVFKGHYARHVVIKVKRAFRQVEGRFQALVIGWRTRRILKTKEIENYVSQIKDYTKAMHDLLGDQSPLEKKDQLQKSLAASKSNTITKMISILMKMHERGLWLMYLNMEKKERKISGTSNSTHKLKDSLSKLNNKEITYQVVHKKRASEQKSFSGYSACNAPNSDTKSNWSATKSQQNQIKSQAVYVTIENEHSQTVAKSVLPRGFIDQAIEGREDPAMSLRSTASFQAKQLQKMHASQGKAGSSLGNCYDYCGNDSRLNDSYQSRDEVNLYNQNHHKSQQPGQQQISTYDQIPIKSFSKGNTVQKTFSLTRSRFEPNFQSDAYKEQAKEIYQRRMHYNPRQAASKSRDNGIGSGAASTPLSGPFSAKKQMMSLTPAKGLTTGKASKITPPLSEYAPADRTQKKKDPDTSLSRDRPQFQQPPFELQERKTSINKYRRDGDKLENSQHRRRGQQNQQQQQQRREDASESSELSAMNLNVKPNYTPQHYSNKHQMRRTREQRKQHQKEDDKMVDPSINMFDTRKVEMSSSASKVISASYTATAHVTSQTSTTAANHHNLFKKRQQ